MVVKKGKTAELSGVDASAANGSKTVFVKNLPWSASDDDIYAFFEGLPIYQVRLAKDFDGRPKGFGHVEFESVEAAAAAIGKSGEYFNDREVYIETTTERQQRTFCLSGIHPGVFVPLSFFPRRWHDAITGGGSSTCCRVLFFSVWDTALLQAIQLVYSPSETPYMEDPGCRLWSPGWTKR